MQIISKSEPASDVVVTAKDEKITSQRKNWLAAFGETFDVEEKVKRKLLKPLNFQKRKNYTFYFFTEKYTEK